MKTVVLTPLFPPDTSDSSRYTKELVRRLPAENLSVIAYGRLHESVPNVTIYPISKRSNKLVRTINCLKKLWQITPDVVLVQNGPSTEFPALLYSWLSSAQFVYIKSDNEAAAKQRSVGNLFQKQAKKTVVLPDDNTTYLPKEWLPFADTHETDNRDMEIWWDTHIKQVTNL